LRELGRGGMGITWLCQDRMNNNSRVVVKGMLIAVLSDPMSKELFKKEVARLREVSGTGIAPAFIEEFSEGACPFIVQEYIAGDTLQSLLATSPDFFTEAHVREFLSQSLNALHKIHTLSILHRDLKLSNIMRRESDGKYFLIDFGVSKLLAQGQMSGHTKVGTPLYTTPEMHVLGKSTYKTDLYCVGLCALVLITKSEPDAYLLRAQELRGQLETIITDQAMARCIRSLIDPIEATRVANVRNALTLLS